MEDALAPPVVSPQRGRSGRLLMRIVRASLAVLLAALQLAPAAQAQTHVIGKSALSQAVQQRVSQDQADRDAIRSLLQRPEVRQIASQAGVSLEQAQAAVSTLNGQDLRTLAAQSRQVQNDLAGGASTVVISTTTIIIVLLIIILIVAVALGTAAAAFSQTPSRLLDVPYVLQSEELCGGAAAAMVMRFWGATGVYAEGFSSLVDKEARGIRAGDLIATLRRRGWQADSFSGDRDLIQRHLQQRRPPIVLIEAR